MKTKNICIVIFSILLSFTYYSCETDGNLQPEGEWDLSAPVVLTPTSEQSIILNQDTPSESVTFSWEAAESSLGYAVTYKVMLLQEGTVDFSEPIFISESSNNGINTSLSISYEALDQALAFSGFPANENASLTLAVQASSLSKTSTAFTNINLKRFENQTLPQNLYISGTATENNNDLSQAIALKRLTNSDGALTNIYEVYTSLIAGESYKFYSERSLPALQFGGSEGNIVPFGEAIVASTSGQFRIKVDLDTNTYELLQINFWSMVGTPISGGWGGDQPLEYQGNSVWKASINLLESGGFIFRANGDWSYLLKQIVGTTNTLVLEVDASSQGVTVEDMSNNPVGLYFVTLDLSADNYNYSFEIDDTIIEPIITPTQLFLFENGNMIEEFSLDGDTFSSNHYIPMQASNVYSLNSAADGSGTSYTINQPLADSTTPDGDLVSDTLTLIESNNTFSVITDRALQFSIDFSAPTLTWTYYNIKLFHWQVWDDRQEIAMTYNHPNTYTVTTNLTAGYDSKFISPWDLDFGSDNPTALTGNLINGGGSNLLNINTDGTYTVTIILNDDYQTGTYEFAQ
ncbi:SusE domain-containing protein [Olleya sp. ITB9]|uniref:SusE domain-containing protein n=1 Tax=Olleya sp. ITB9 TaxID=1715648 RepID=UPI0006D11F3F|nr:SusE domain-containing protein [Olleya sp. ITB9]